MCYNNSLNFDIVFFDYTCLQCCVCSPFETSECVQATMCCNTSLNSDIVFFDYTCLQCGIRSPFETRESMQGLMYYGTPPKKNICNDRELHRGCVLRLTQTS